MITLRCQEYFTRLYVDFSSFFSSSSTVNPPIPFSQRWHLLKCKEKSANVSNQLFPQVRLLLLVPVLYIKSRLKQWCMIAFPFLSGQPGFWLHGNRCFIEPLAVSSCTDEEELPVFSIGCLCLLSVAAQLHWLLRQSFPPLKCIYKYFLALGSTRVTEHFHAAHWTTHIKFQINTYLFSGSSVLCWSLSSPIMHCTLSQECARLVLPGEVSSILPDSSLLLSW